jgi:hypothetical protein
MYQWEEMSGQCQVIHISYGSQLPNAKHNALHQQIQTSSEMQILSSGARVQQSDGIATSQVRESQFGMPP